MIYVTHHQAFTHQDQQLRGLTHVDLTIIETNVQNLGQALPQVVNEL